MRSSVALWLCGSVALWLCSSVALWQNAHFVILVTTR
jgi:hypothetical protein